MSTTRRPADIQRIHPPQFTTRGWRYNRDHAEGIGALADTELVWIPELGRFVVSEAVAAGLPHYYGPVADEAAMLALHAPEAYPPRWVAAGDKCRRTDTGAVMECVAGNGTSAGDWLAIASHESVTALSSAVTALSSEMDDLATTASLAALSDEVDGKWDAPANAAALARITASPGNPPLWDDAPWPAAGGSGASVPLAMWLDAANARTSAGAVPDDGASTVAHWIDTSGRGMTPTQPNAGYYPTYRAAAINGLPAVEFSGSGAVRHLFVAATVLDFAASGAVEMLFVFRRLSSAGSAIVTWVQSPRMQLLAAYAGTAYWDWVTTSTGRITSTAASLVSSTDWIVLGARRDGDRSILSVNGVDLATSGIAPLRYSPLANLNMYIGGNGADSIYGNCQIAEAKIWAGSLTPYERSAQVDALRTKYAI